MERGGGVMKCFLFVTRVDGCFDNFCIPKLAVHFLHHEYVFLAVLIINIIS